MKNPFRLYVPAFQRVGRTLLGKARREMTQEEQDEKKQKKESKKSLLKHAG